jgi:hypothetical protein
LTSLLRPILLAKFEAYDAQLLPSTLNTSASLIGFTESLHAPKLD